MKKFIAILLAAVLITSLVLSGCSESTGGTESTNDEVSGSDEQIAFRLGYPSTGVVAGAVGIAIREGYFEEEFEKINVSFEAVPFAKAGPAINTAIESNEIDGAIMLGDVPAAIAKAQGSDTTLIDIQPKDFGVHLLIRSDLGITDVKDLAGKKVAVQTSSYLQRILYQILEENGLTANDVELVNMAQSDAISAIAAGSIDATLATEINGIRLEQEDSVELLFDTESYSEMAALDTTVVRTEYAEEHPEVLKAYFAAILRAKDYAIENPDVLRTIFLESGENEEIVDIAYPELSDYGADVGATDESKAIMNTVIDFLHAADLITTDLELDDWFDNSYYEAALADYEG